MWSVYGGKPLYGKVRIDNNWTDWPTTDIEALQMLVQFLQQVNVIVMK